MKQYTIPFFIPFEGCPNRCVFCDQNRITGADVPSPGTVPEKIERYLGTMPVSGVRIEVGFFGGSFTGLDRELQSRYLDRVRPFLDAGRVHGARLSTRPDMVDASIASFLRAEGVSCVELGVQSMSDTVLLKAGRGHTARDTEMASRSILEEGMVLGHQIMLGLPGSTFEDELMTARRAIECGATQIRIYPLLVIKSTELARMWREGLYSPLTLEEAVKRAGRLIQLIESSGARVIRCGLHPSEGLISGGGCLAGPFHPAFGQMARNIRDKG